MDSISSFNQSPNNQLINPLNKQDFDPQLAIRNVVLNAVGGDTFSSEKLPQESSHPFTFDPMLEAVTTEKVIEAGDKDGNESLNKDELIDLLKQHISHFDIKSDKALGRLFKELDKNNDGELSAEEITDPMQLLFKAKIQNARDVAELILDKGDKDEDGGMSTEEITPMVEHYFNLYSDAPEQSERDYQKQVIQNIFTKLDTDNNNKLDINELVKLYEEMRDNIDPIDGKGAFKTFEPKEKDNNFTNPQEKIIFEQA